MKILSILLMLLITKVSATDIDIEDLNFEFSSITINDDEILVDNGGFITISNNRIKISAKTIRGKKNDKGRIEKVSAYGNLSIVFDGKLFVGDKLDYNVSTKILELHEGCTSFGFTFFYGKKIVFDFVDNSYKIIDANVKTSLEKDDFSHFLIHSDAIFIDNDGNGKTNMLVIKNRGIPIFYLPPWKFKISETGNTISTYRIIFKSKHVRFLYPLFSTQNFSSSAILDYRYGKNLKGIGGGMRSRYKSEAFSVDNENFVTKNLDKSLKRNSRYRIFAKGKFTGKKWICDFSYDRISDTFFFDDYSGSSSFSNKKSLPTMTHISFIGNDKISIFAKANKVINDFETDIERLPSFGYRIMPITIGKQGPVFENFAFMENLHFVNKHDHNDNFHSCRTSMVTSLYFPKNFASITLTPTIELQNIIHSNSPQKNSTTQNILHTSIKASSFLKKNYKKFTHCINPYISFDFFSKHKKDIDDVFVFDNKDFHKGLKKITFGIQQEFFSDDYSESTTSIDIFSKAILSRKSNKIPRWYAKISNRTKKFFTTVETSIDSKKLSSRDFKISTEFAHNNKVSCQIEYRHRRYNSWKNNDEGFLETLYSDDSLKKSSMSDPRDSLLMKIFYKISPDTTLTFETINGFKKSSTSKNYHEQLLRSEKLLYGQWRLRLSLKRNFNKKFSFFFTLYLPIDPQKSI